MAIQQKGDILYCEYFSIIQKVITRMAQNSFMIKAWSITIIAAIIVLTYSIMSILIFGVLLIISIIFWTLDSYYLKIERLYRRLYNSKVEEYNNDQKREGMILFDMNFKPFINQEQKVPRIMFSKSEFLFYIPIIAALVTFLMTSLIMAL